MNLTQLVQHLRTKTPRTNYYLWGEDEVQLYISERKILARFSDPEKVVDKYSFDGKFNKWSEVIDALSEDFLMSDIRIVVVRNFDKFKSNKDEFIKVITQKDPSRIIVVSANYRRHPDGFPKLGSMVGDVHCKPFEEYKDSIKTWIDLELEDLKLPLSEDFKNLLIETYGNNIDKILNVISQISLFKGSEEINEDFFRELLVSMKNYSYFDLVNVVCHRAKSKALEIISSMIQADDFNLKLFVKLMDKQLRLIYRLSVLMKENIPRESLAVRLEINPFFLTGLMNQAQKWDHDRIARAYEYLMMGFTKYNHSLYDAFSMVNSLCS